MSRGKPLSPHQDATAGALVDLWSRAHTGEVRDLLAASMVDATPEQLDALVLFYRERPGSRLLMGWAEAGAVRGVIGAHLVLPHVVEVLNLAVDSRWRRRGIAAVLVEAACERLDALAVRADTDGEATSFWEACGFVLSPIGGGRMRAQRRHPPEPDGFFTRPRSRVVAPRHLSVELPPEGNTLPLVPDTLEHLDLPAFVVEWILEADEVGLLMQELAPDLLPPVTPAVRTHQLDDLVGPLPGTPDPPESGGALTDLPAGLMVPLRVAQLAEAGRRIAAWLDKARRVRRWAEAHGREAESWFPPPETPSEEPDRSNP